MLPLAEFQVFSGGKHIRSANDLVQATDLQEMSPGGTNLKQHAEIPWD